MKIDGHHDNDLPPPSGSDAGTGDEQDFLDEMIAERARENPEFPRLVEEATQRRERLRALAAERRARQLAQSAEESRGAA